MIGSLRSEGGNIYGIYYADACHGRQKYICAQRTLLGIRSMKRGNTYSVRYNYKDHAGKPCKGWETFKTKAEAQERKITVEKELLDGTFLVPDTMTVEEIAQLLAISNRAAYNLCNTTKDFKVIRLGTSIRVSKQSFDDWFAAV